MIIAFGHRRNVGKDSCADFVNLWGLERGVSVGRFSFAAAVKEKSFEMFGYLGLKRASYYDLHYDERTTPVCANGPCARDIWIHVGTQMRALHSDVWAEKFEPTTKTVTTVTDLRFPNEVNVVRRYKGCRVIKVVRDVEQFTDDADQGLADFDGWDAVAQNNGSRHDLRHTVYRLMDTLWVSEH